MESGKIATVLMDEMMKRYEFCKNEFFEISKTKDRMLAYQLINDTYTQWDCLFTIGTELITDNDILKLHREFFKNVSVAIDTFFTEIGRWDN
jgi:hypothetical protein